MKTKKSKRQDSIPLLVERGFAIHQQLVTLNEEFKKIKDRLKTEAVCRSTERIPLLDKDSEGEQWIAKGNNCECRIVFPAPSLKISFDPSQPVFTTIRTTAGDHFNALFRKVTIFEVRQRKGFRRQVFSLLDADDAKFLLDVCSGPSETKAIWKSRLAGKEQV